MKASLRDRFYGCLVGGAIGDALGAPVESLNYWEIEAKHGRLVELVGSPRGNSNGKPGAVTDDTALRSYVAMTIVRRKGRIRPDDLAAFWVEKGNSKRFWANERAVHERLAWGMNPWETGRGAHKCATASMAIAPVGLINAGDPAQAYQDGYNIGAVMQDEEERDAAGAFAAAVAAALLPGATATTAREAMLAQSGFLMRRAVDLAMDLRFRVSSTAEFTRRYYELYADWRFPRPEARLAAVPASYPARARYYSGTSLELVPVAFALMDLCGADGNEAMVAAVNFGRDCDTIATFVGCLGGALHGAAALRANWVAACERDNEDLFAEVGEPGGFAAMAGGLLEALRAEQARTEQRAAAMRHLLEG